MREWLTIGLDVLAFLGVGMCLYYTVKINAKLPNAGMLFILAGFVVIMFLRILLLARDFGYPHLASSGEFSIAYILIGFGFRGIYSAVLKVMK